MQYYTIGLEIEEDLSSSDLLAKMKEEGIRWGKCIGKKPVRREEIISYDKKHYMKIGYE